MKMKLPGLLIIVLIIVILLTTACSQAEQISAGVHTLKSSQQLKSCPDTPNCINTEYPEKTAQYVPPLVYDETRADQIMIMAKNTILQMGGSIIKEEPNYLSATFTSMIFRFVDDFEVRNDVNNHTLQIRSASRTGYSDFGVNKRRVEAFLKQFDSPFIN